MGDTRWGWAMTNLVIGAGSGMGAAVAKTLAPRGRLVIADRDLRSVERVAHEIGGSVEALECDVTDRGQIDALVKTIDDLGALVLTAGLSGSMANGRRIFEVNLIGTARVLAAMEPLLRPGTVGVCFASMSGHRVPDRAELLRILEDPTAGGFFDALEAIGIDPDQTEFAYPRQSRCPSSGRPIVPGMGSQASSILSVSPGINDTPMNRLNETRHPIMADIISSSPLGRRRVLRKKLRTWSISSHRRRRRS